MKQNIKKMFFLIILILVISPTNTFAKSGKAGGNCLNKVHISWTPSDISTADDTYGVKVTVDEGSWKVYANHIEDDDIGELFNDGDKLKASVKSNFTTIDSSTPFEITNQSLKKEGKTLVLFVKLNSTIKNSKGDVICSPGYFIRKGNSVKITSEAGNANKIGEGTGLWKSISLSTYDDDLAAGTNSSKDACSYMRQGIYKNNGEKNEKKDISGYQNNTDYVSKMKNYFPYCWTETDNANIEFSNRTINSARKNFIDYYKKATSIKYSSATEINAYRSLIEKLQGSDSWIEKSVSGDSDSTYKTEIGGLKCDNSQTTDVTKQHWAQKKVLDNDYCSVKCTEQMTTTYNPPKAVKAGLCLTYKVTVKSKVTCITESKNNTTWPSNKVKGCKYKAVCEDGSDQAGPNDEFDSCVNKCDGGKYSQSCINKCYKKVYENTSKKSNSEKSNSTIKKTSLISNNSNMVLLANTDKSDPYEYYEENDNSYFKISSKCDTYSELSNNLDKCAKGFKEAKDTEPLGHYNKSGKKYTWVPDDGVKTGHTNKFVGTNRKTGTGSNSVVNSIKRAAPYYLRTVSSTKQLLLSLFGYPETHNGFPGNSRRYYNIDENGVKRQVSENWSCPETCWFKQSESSATGCISTDKEAYEIYKNEIDLKMSEIEACKSTAENLCSTSEATFNITGTNNTRTIKKPASEHVYSNANQSGNKDDKKVLNKEGTTLAHDIFVPIKEDTEPNSNGVNGICYGIDYEDHHYKTTITFPGAYINLKTGAVVYADEDKIQTDTYRKKEYAFCTALNSVGVNNKWWQQKMSLNASGETLNNTEIDDYNITSEVTSFGKFNWHLNLSCFYALPSNGCVCENAECKNCSTTPPPDGDPQCTGDNCLDAYNYSNRIVAVGSTDGKSNLFPNRTPGFNWTSEATDKSLAGLGEAARGYDLNPQDYVDSLSTTSAEKEQESDSKLDLWVHLDSNDFNNIKTYISNNGLSKFNAPNGSSKDSLYTKVSTVEGLWYYKSPFLETHTSIIKGGNRNNGSQYFGYNYTK